MCWHKLLLLAAITTPFLSAPVPSQAAPLTPAARAAAAKKWKLQIVAWYAEAKAVANPQEEYDKIEEILGRIESIRDPLAIPAIAELLADQDQQGHHQMLEALRHMPSPETLKVLVKVACENRDPTARKKAAELITDYPERKVREIIPQFCKYIVGGRFRGPALEALKDSKIAEQISPGAVPNRQLVFTLINTLFTEEKIKIPGYRASGRWYSSVRGGGMGFSGRPDIVITISVPKEEVLQVLKQYSGQDYGYDQEAWRNWYHQQYAQNKPNAPR